MVQKAQYRKHNDRQQNSSTYHKKDGTNIKAILKHELIRDLRNDSTYEYTEDKDAPV